MEALQAPLDLQGERVHDVVQANEDLAGNLEFQNMLVVDIDLPQKNSDGDCPQLVAGSSFVLEGVVKSWLYNCQYVDVR